MAKLTLEVEEDYDFEETFPEHDGWCMCDYCLEYKEYETMTSVSKEHGEEETPPDNDN